MGVVSSAIVWVKRKIPVFDKKAKVYKNGEKNNYPEFVENAISESVTASRCAKLMAAYLTGKGFGDKNDTIVHEEDQTTLLQFTQQISESISEHYGVFIHVNYNLKYECTDLSVLNFSDCRIGKKDDNRYNGKILVCDDWSDIKSVKKARVIDVYNPRKKVIQSQIDKAKGIDNYNGQVLYFKFGKYVYPLAPIHPALNDAGSEHLASKYKNVILEKGFFGKTVVFTKPLVDDDLKEDDPKKYSDAVSEREKFRETIQKFIGAGNADGILHLEMEFDSDKIEDEILFKNIESNIDDKLFAHTEKTVADNIRMCFNNVPPGLIQSSDGKLFGTSGDGIKQMKIFYQDQTEMERLIVEGLVSSLLEKFEIPIKGLKITPLIQVGNANN